MPTKIESLMMDISFDILNLSTQLEKTDDKISVLLEELRKIEGHKEISEKKLLALRDSIHAFIARAANLMSSSLIS